MATSITSRYDIARFGAVYHEMGDDEAAEQHLEKSLELAGLHRSVDWSEFVGEVMLV
jgi:hypothetical protein